MTKKLHYLLSLYALILSGFALQAQTPQRISYQAVVRVGEQNTPVVNAACGVRISILQQSENGAAVYVERHTSTTNANGLLTLAIGGGNVQSGSFAAIDWANGPYFVKTEIDPNGGTTYLITSTTQLLTVPYALHSKTAETVTGNVAFEKITGVPAGFTGNYNDLTNKPAIFSGNYADLNGKPTLAAVATTGNYNDLTGKPALATVAATGDYNDLKNRPTLGENGFSGSYNDLSNKPSFKDSIATYGFNGAYSALTGKPTLANVATSGNYSDLSGKPTLAIVATTGSYNDLTDKPVISGNGFSGAYADLSGKPNIKDSIATYGFNGDYANLRNKPTLATVATTGSYNDLTDKPTGSFGGNYNELTNKPNIKDSIATYGFDGDYGKLTNKPSNVSHFNNDAGYVTRNDIRDNLLSEGENVGDMLYWSGKGWNILPAGQNGQVLTVKDGRPVWASATANTYEIGDIYLDNGVPKGIIADIDGNTGILVSFDEYAGLAWGRNDTLINSTNAKGYLNTNIARAVWNYGTTTYPAAYTCVSLGADEWYLPSKEEMATVYDNRNYINTKLQTLGKTPLQADAYWTSSEKDAGNAFLLQFKTAGTNFAGTAISVKKESALAVRAMRQLTKMEINSRPDNYHLYAIGDVYYEAGVPTGIVYEISDMGLHGKIIALEERDFSWYQKYNEEDESPVPFCSATNETDGMQNRITVKNFNVTNENNFYEKEYTAFFWNDEWYLPAKEEWSVIYAQKNVINTTLTGLGISEYIHLLQFEISYWSSTEIDANNAYSVSFDTGSAASSAKSDINSVRAIRKF